MSKFNRLFKLFSLTILVVLIGTITFLAVEQSDKTLSPYFFIESKYPDVDRMPLKSTSAEVNIAGVIADIKVTQIYKNEGTRTLEAIYVFPASTHAAVYGMKMTIGDRTIVANIEEREKARNEYKQAKSEGKSASLLEQERPNVFQMKVANILPGDEIQVELYYTELLIPTDNIYEFIYPTVVGPRYSNLSQKEAPSVDKFVKAPYQREGSIPSYDFNIGIYLSAGMPISSIKCETHKVNIEYDQLTSAKINLDQSETKGGNRDFVLKYELSGGKIESGILLYKGEEENFFLLMVQPPEHVETKDIPPRDYVFVMDVSGSMDGFPIEVSKRLLRNMISNLRSTDTFNVVLFAGDSTILSEQSLPATKENIQSAINIIENQHGGGGTELVPALKEAFNLIGSNDKSHTIVIVTDGFVSAEKEAFDVIRENLNKANSFAFGIGSSVNRYLIDGISKVGMGEPYIVENEEKAAIQSEIFRKYIASPVLTKINTSFDYLDVYDVEPPSIPDLFAERPIMIFGKYKGELKGRIYINGLAANNSQYTTQFIADDIKTNIHNKAIRYLWARHKLEILEDYNHFGENEERKNNIIQLSLKYNLLSPYTSFIAIDTQVRLDGEGKPVVVKQALPLPEGVSESSVGFSPMVINSVPFNRNYSQIAFLAPTSPNSEEKIKIDKISSDNKNLSPSLLRENIENKIATLKTCCGSIKKGKITIKLIIDRYGKINQTRIMKSNLSNSTINCLLEEFKKWKFGGLKIKNNLNVVISLSI